MVFERRSNHAETERDSREQSPQNETDAKSNTSPQQLPEEVPACQSCRKRKLKCSREMPSCSQCSRLSCPCVYDHKKQKPGLKSGAVEGLNRRIEVLERLVLNRDAQNSIASAESSVNGQIHQAALLIANSLTAFIGDNAAKTQEKSHANGHSTMDDIFSNSEHDSMGKRNNTDQEYADQYPAKRTRTEFENFALLSYMSDGDDVSMLFPPSNILETAIDLYFRKIHPWIPCIHRASFNVRWRSETEEQKLTILVHAMLTASMRHLPFQSMGLKEADIDRQVRLSREVVMRNAMDHLSVENVAALIIITFDHLVEGRLSNAWPLIGCMTRTVEYLQLTRETDDKPRRALQRPLISMGEPKTWSETEERRRVFWNVFLLDRFCSVVTGWSTSLTSNDVRRRLPCDGELWAQGGPTVTPFFGIWDKSAARIGNSIASISSQRLNPNVPESGPSKLDNNPSPASYSSNVGAFAYRIEATESLSQVTSFFLQQPVDFRNRQEVGSWLTRFKELDLRLVHWKLFLPQQWKDSNKSREKYVFKMDTNLTLAHMTHNTSMILLHQHIAYPPVALTEIVKLPSACSAETCQLAAIETAHITQKYLKHAESDIVPAQFAFCVFIAARVLLVHWKFYNVALNPEFFILLDSLGEMSMGLQGSRDRPAHLCHDIAAKYAHLLQTIHTRCLDNLHSRADVLFHCDIISELSPVQPFCMPPPPPPPPLPQRRQSDSTPYQSSDSYRYESLGPTYPTPSQYLETDKMPQASTSNDRFSHNPEAFYLNPLSSTSNGSNNMVDTLPPPIGPEAMELASHLCNLSQQGSPTPHRHPHHSHSHPHPPDSMSMLPSESSSGSNRIVPFNTNTNNTNDITINGNNDGSSQKQATTSDSPDDELTVMSNVLMNPQFSEMDRVITLNGTDFSTFDTNIWGNFSESEF